MVDDARAVEAVYQAVLDAADQPLLDGLQCDDRDEAYPEARADRQQSQSNGTAVTDTVGPSHHESPTPEQVNRRVQNYPHSK